MNNPSAETVSATLGGYKKPEGGYMCHCPCPNHKNGDKHESLSVDDGDNGQLILYCFGGGSFAEVASGLLTKGIKLNGNARSFTAEEKAAAAKLQEKREKERQAGHATAAKKAASIWTAATAAPADNPYLVKKGVVPVESLREIDMEDLERLLFYHPKAKKKGGDAVPLAVGKVLVVPIKVEGKLSTLEFIDGNGLKSAIFGGRKSGGYWAPPPLPEGGGDGQIILIGEGAATVLSAREATGYPVVAALSAGNLMQIAKAMRQRYPAATIAILADLGNGQQAAAAAATAIAGLCLVPELPAERGAHDKDFNDMARLVGKEAVDSCIRGQLAAGAGQDPTTGTTDATESADDTTIKMLAGLPVVDYEKVRKERAKELGVRASVLDELVDGHRKNSESQEAAAKKPTGDEDEPEVIKELGGFKFIEPKGFEVIADRVNKRQYKDGIETKKTVLFTPLLITGCAVNIDAGTEEVEITFKQRRKWKSIWVAKRAIMDIKKLVELSDHGLQVSSVNAKMVIEYLCAFESCNFEMIRQSHVVKGLGWKTVQGRKVFILHKMVVNKSGKRPESDDNTPEIEFVAEPGFERFVKAMEPKGAYDEWRGFVSTTLKYPIASFAFYAAFAAPLLRILKAPNFIIDFWGDTSKGKTTVLELASSVWGNPHKEAGGLVFSWDSTKVFLERMASFFNDCPIFPDDSQTVDDRTMMSALYQIANGVGKGRGSLIGIRQNPTWHTVCFSTGERPLEQCTTFSGARARTISLYGSPFPGANAEFINDLKQALRESYGHAGPLFIEGIMALWDRPAEMTRLKEEYRNLQRGMSLTANSEVGDRYSHYFAVVKLAARLVHKILGIGDQEEAEKSIDRVFGIVLSESLAHVDVSTRAMEFILSWANANETYFKASSLEKFGVWREDEYIGIFPHKLTELLKKEGYSERAILRGWAERGWIERTDKNRFQVQKRDNSGPIRLVVIPWQVAIKFNE